MINEGQDFPNRQTGARRGMSRFLSAALPAVLAFGGSPASFGQAAVQYAPQAGHGPIANMRPQTLAQISALEAEEASRTPAQKKLDSHLWYAAKMQTGQAIAAAVPTLRVGLLPTLNGYAEVDITADVTDDLLKQISAAGGKVISSHPDSHAIRASLPVSQMEALASLPSVRFIKPAVLPMIQGQSMNIVAAGRTRAMRYVSQYFRRPGKERREQMLRDRLPSLVQSAIGSPLQAMFPGVGSIVSEGDTTHRAALARTTFNVDGTGIKIGVISDSDDFLESSQASGDLGQVTVLSGQSGRPGTGEGTAMMEIVHDIVPGAQIYFATCGNSEADFAANIKALAAAGCQVIVDDIAFSDESPFQDGIPAQAVQYVTAHGVHYFSSADNYGNVTDGTACAWSADFIDSGMTMNGVGGGKIATVALPNGQTIYENGVTDNSGRGQNPFLFWTDPLGHSTNDYNLFVVDFFGDVAGASTTVQNGTQDPMEFITGVPSGYSVIIVQHSGQDRFLHMDLASQGGKLDWVTPSRTRGHATVNAVGAYGVAATPASVATPNYGAPTGPYPNAFNKNNKVEYFSSDGPSHQFYKTDGTAITPNDLSWTGGLILQKPDITAADGVHTSLNSGVTGPDENFDPFFGTSAAAPHAAAITGLLLSYNPKLTQAQVRNLLTSTAIDIMTPGWDRDSGAGIIDAYALLNAAPKALPAITLFTPASGTVGTKVTITGTNLTGATAVKFHGTPSTSVTVVNATTVTAIVPAGATTGTIAVTTPNGTATSTASFTVTAAAPSVMTFQPASGVAGTNVTIAGANLTGATVVTFGGKPAAVVNVLSPACIMATAPADAVTGVIAVTTPGGIANSAAKFTVLPGAPTVTTYAPASGAVGTKVTVTGTNLTGATAVKFNGYASTSVVILSATSLTATVPVGATTGNISVTTPAGLAYSSNAFVITPTAPTATVFSPATGYAGVKVTVKGTNLLGATAVTFNGVASTSITSVTATSLIATVPAGATTGKIAVTTPGGTASTATNFTVTAAPPTIVAFQGTSGPVGTKVIIAGTNLTGTTSVKFNGKPVTIVTVLSDQFVQATVPAGATTGVITLTTAAGTATSAGKFTVTP